MNKTKILKGLALVNFIGLVTVFLFFRNGSFSKNSLTSPNGGTQTKVSKDSIPQKKDSIGRQRLSSSKSVVIIDNMNLKKDSTKPKEDSIKINQSEEEKRLMYSSKSGIIIDPPKFKTDSFIFKTKNSKKKKN